MPEPTTSGTVVESSIYPTSLSRPPPQYPKHLTRHYQQFNAYPNPPPRSSFFRPGQTTTRRSEEESTVDQLAHDDNAYVSSEAAPFYVDNGAHHAGYMDDDGLRQLDFNRHSQPLDSA